jgi:hypothetical protein
MKPTLLCVQVIGFHIRYLFLIFIQMQIPDLTVLQS